MTYLNKGLLLSSASYDESIQQHAQPPATSSHEPQLNPPGPLSLSPYTPLVPSTVTHVENCSLGGTEPFPPTAAAFHFTSALRGAGSVGVARVVLLAGWRDAQDGQTSARVVTVPSWCGLEAGRRPAGRGEHQQDTVLALAPRPTTPATTVQRAPTVGRRC